MTPGECSHGAKLGLWFLRPGGAGTCRALGFSCIGEPWLGQPWGCGAHWVSRGSLCPPLQGRMCAEALAACSGQATCEGG